MTKYRNEIRSEGERLDFVLELGKTVSFTRPSLAFRVQVPDGDRPMISFALSPKKLIIGEKTGNDKKTTDAYSHCY